MADFWRFLWPIGRYKGYVAVGLAASFLNAVCTLGGFAGLYFIVDQFFNNNLTLQDWLLARVDQGWIQSLFPGVNAGIGRYVPADRFWGYCIMMGALLLVTVLRALMRIVHQSMIDTAMARLAARVRIRVYRHILGMPVYAMQSVGQANLIVRMSSDLDAISRGIRILLGGSIRSLLTGAMLFALAVWMDWQLTAFFLLAAPPMAIVIRRMGTRIRRATRRGMEQSAKVLGVMQHSLLQLPVVKLHQAEGFERRRFQKELREVTRYSHKMLKLGALGPPLIETFAIMAVMLMSVIAGWYVMKQGTVDPLALLKVIGTLAAAGVTLKPLSSLNSELQIAAAGANRVQEVFAYRQEVRGGGRLPLHRQRIEFRDVLFSFPGRDEPAVNRVNLTVEHGMTVAIVGPNGSGKTTLLSMLPRLYRPQEGAIFIDGVDTATVSLRSLRRQMAMVTQTSGLFEGTIAENIAYGMPSLTLAQIEAAAQAAFAHEFIVAMPEGYQTALGTLGHGLSGGQRQRICIARAILRNPAILILDEATSQIDADSERKINEAVREFRQGRTTFIIAHRLSTVVDADMIVVMEHGRIVATGKHMELLASCSLYQLLNQTQLVGAAEGLAP